MFRALPQFLAGLALGLAAIVSLAFTAAPPGLPNSPGKPAAKAPAVSTPIAGNRTLAVAPQKQGRRIALVIGNGDYQYPDKLPKLANPANDAQDIAAALRGFGFEVIERKNQTLEAMNQTIAEFGSRIGGSEAALFYFAGHGIQVKNQNYLMPVNARVESEAVVPYQGVNINQVLDEMDNAKSSANIVMLDACRNNPITGKFRSGKSRGLASPGSTPKGTVIVYATDPGNVAADGEGRNGLFTAGLLTAFKGKDLSLDDVLTVASAEVERASGQTQTPYVNGPKTLQKNFHFRVAVDSGRGETAQAAVASAPTAAAAAREDSETQFWNEAKAGDAKEYLDAYLKQYPNGKYLALARIELQRLDERERQETLRKEQAAWDEAKSRANSTAYASYLERYPAGRYAALAQAAQQKLQREAKQDAAQADKWALAAHPQLEMKTSQGTLVIELYRGKAPKSVENFLQYVNDGYFDGTIFHRVIADFMIQGGGFTPDMKQKSTRPPIQNEAKNGLKNQLGTLAMARTSDPHSASAQFFINLKENGFLDYPSRDGWGYAVFGRVVQGLDVVQKIARVPTGNSGQHQNVPTTPVVIEAVRLLPAGK